MIVALCVPVLAGCTHMTQPASVPTATAATSPERIVCLGDSITDGQTYALLVEQALREAGRPVPKFYPAGIGGDTSAGMRARLERDVLVFKPTLVTVSCGVNDMGGGMSLADYEANVVAIIERLQRERVKVMLLTTSNFADRLAADQKQLAPANAVLHRLAAKYQLPVAEVFDRMEEARNVEKGGLWEADGCHLNLAGFRAMARAILDALGEKDVPVPTEMKLTPLPGILREWRVKVIADDKAPRLDDAGAAAIQPDVTWKTLLLPDPKPADGWWWDQERQRGFAVSLRRDFAPGTRFVCVADVPAKSAERLFLNTGGELGPVWLNGVRVFGKGEPPKGWHAGGYRLPVELVPGVNRIVLETNGRFCLSLTPDDQW